MVAVLRAHGLKVDIYLDDHEPAHVNVFGDGQAKVDLVGTNGSPELVCADGMKRNEIRRAMALVADHRDSLLERWKNLDG